MGNKNTIEFNGKIYDVVTGKLVNAESPAVGRSTKIQVADGLNKPKPPPKKVLVKPATSSKPKHQVAKHHHGHRPARSMALMRSSVDKPTPTRRPTAKAQATSSAPAKFLPASPIALRLALSERRLVRAQQTSKSPGVRHFKSSDNDRAFKRLKPLPIKKPSTASDGLKPVAKIEELPAINKLDNILAAGLARATSHEQPKPSAAKPASKQLRNHARQARWLILISVAVVIILVVGMLLAYFTPGIELSVATSRSGVHVSLPTYQPAGYHFSGTSQYARGALTLNFGGRKPAQKFNIIAQNSNWDSQTLLYSFVTDIDPNYQTLQKADLTLYIYRQTNVTWVNGGIWYRLSSLRLSANQLADIAVSM